MTNRDGPPVALTDAQIIEALLEHCDKPAAKGAATKAVERIRQLRAAIPSPLPSDEEIAAVFLADDADVATPPNPAHMKRLWVVYGHALQTAKEHPDDIDEMIATLKARS